MKIRSIIENNAHNPLGDEPMYKQSNTSQHTNKFDDDFWQDDDPFGFIDDPQPQDSDLIEWVKEYTNNLKNLDEDTLAQQASSMFTSDLIDFRDSFQTTYPFIYDETVEPKLHVGRENEYHDDIIRDLVAKTQIQSGNLLFTRNDVDFGAEKSLNNSYRKGKIGRIGIGLRFTKKDYYTVLDKQGEMIGNDDINDCMDIVAEAYEKLKNSVFIAVANMQTDLLHTVVKAAAEFVSKNIKADRYYILYDTNCFTYQTFMGSEQAEASDENKELANLQVALHLGAWPNGKPLTAAERKQIRAKLGIGPAVSNKKTWSGEFNKAGITKPGQKWWAMTSEGKN